MKSAPARERDARGKVRGAVGTSGVGRDLVFFAVLAALASVFAWTRIEGTLAGYKLLAAQSGQADLLREREALKLELASRRAPGRIEADAREKLGMVDPAKESIYPVRRGPPAVTASLEEPASGQRAERVP